MSGSGRFCFNPDSRFLTRRGTRQTILCFQTLAPRAIGHRRAFNPTIGGRMNLLVELRLALRRLSKQPGFMVTTIVTLALAIGANTAIFSVVYAVLMHPSGVDAPERLAVMHTRYAQLGLDFPDVSVPDYADAASLKDQVESAALENGVAYNAVHDGTIEHLDGALVPWQWFNVFGAKPILGRTFTPEEDHPNANQVAV